LRTPLLDQANRITGVDETRVLHGGVDAGSPFVTAIQELHQREKRSSGERSLGIISNETAKRVSLVNENR
jgi:hypothetical protein